jgi:hypothetical protein
MVGLHPLAGSAVAAAASIALAELESEVGGIMHVGAGVEARRDELDVLEYRMRRVDKAVAEQVRNRYQVDPPLAFADQCRQIGRALVG